MSAAHRPNDPVAALEKRIGRRFKDRALLQEALTHASAAEGRKTLGGSPFVNNERLEFLGDRVLGMVCAELLWRRFAQIGESGLAPRLNALVNRAALAGAARRVGLGEALTLSKAEAVAGGRDKDTILADSCEALIAALYLDGGLKAARAFVESVFAAEIDALSQAPRDPKTALQEWAAATRRSAPAYEVVARTGPDHAPAFVVEVTLEGLACGRGEAGSKREAERAAAADLLKTLGV